MRKTFKRLKIILSFTLAIFMGVSILGISINADAKKKSSSNTYAAGDDIAFGTLDGTKLSWTILSYDDTTKMAFIVSRKPLTSYTITNYRQAIEKNFIATGQKAGYVRWSENYWRGWCNEVFYNNSFTEEERAMIQKTTLTSEDAQKSLMNFYHDTSLDANYVASKVKNSLYMDIYNSQTTTSDYIFFLSSDEYTDHKDSMKFETGFSWPLRTNSYDDPSQGLFVNDTTQLIDRRYYYGGDGIRPAMYVKLGDVDETSTASSSDSTSSTSNSTQSNASTSTSTSNSATSTTASTTSSTATATTANTAATVKTKSYANNGTNIGNIYLPDDSSHSLSVGGTAQVAIDMEYLNSTDKDYTITYKSSNASIFTVDSNGKVTAVGSGAAVLSVRMKKSNGKVYNMSCRIDVS